MGRAERKRLRKGFKQLKTAFKWLFIMLLLLLLIWLLWSLIDLATDYNLLIERVRTQENSMNELHFQLNEAMETNTVLNQQLEATQYDLSLTQQTVDSLINEKLVQQQPKVFISGEPAFYEEPSIEEKHKLPNMEIPILISGLLTVGRVIISLVPALP